MSGCRAGLWCEKSSAAQKSVRDLKVGENRNLSFTVNYRFKLGWSRGVENWRVGSLGTEE